MDHNTTQDPKKKVYETTAYPDPDCFLHDVEEDIPQSLSVFLEEVMLKSRKSRTPELKNKTVAAAHAIISCVRPRTFHSPLLVSIGVNFHKRFGSRYLINVLSSLGFSCSYNEVQLFESSALTYPPPTPQNTFVQYIFDNADHNVCTIDGSNTFHSLGGIQVITPRRTVVESRPINRLKVPQSASAMGNFSRIPLNVYEKKAKSGLNQLVAEELEEIKSTDEYNVCNLAWTLTKFLEVGGVPSWNAFMEKITREEPFEESEIIFLPFINQPPGNYDTLYSATKFAIAETTAAKRSCCVLTFDQPLYVKTRDIIAGMGQTDIPVFVRLGSFHTLMSFMGSIGFIMGGSGIEELLCTIFAPNSVDKILSGHAYARAVRGHFLVHQALGEIVMDAVNLRDSDKEHIRELFINFSDEPPNFQSLTVTESEFFYSLDRKFACALDEFENHGPTSRLWVQYFKMVSIIKKFIMAERMGNWTLHLNTIREMLPYFHASGHFPYAKAAHMYLQDCENLRYIMSAEDYEKFVNGYFTVRRTSKFWSGTPTDQCIEQSLMRDMKEKGGFTRGRGVSDSVTSKWILTMPLVSKICEGLETFCNQFYSSSDQHVEARCSRQRRDSEDAKKLKQWFSVHHPFPDVPALMSLSTGLLADSSFNSHCSHEVGQENMKLMIGNSFANISLKRANRVKPLSAMTSNITIKDEKCPIDPLLLFQRMCLMKKDNEELRTYFQYEISPIPLSLFNKNGMMRKAKKSALYDMWKPLDEGTITDVMLKEALFVIDGGFLLHRVIWGMNQTFGEICESYRKYVRKYGQSVQVVFDGYANTKQQTKNHEHLLRKHECTTILFTENMRPTVKQEAFLANDDNKTRLITLIERKFAEDDIPVHVAEGDADRLIVETAIKNLNSFQRVVVIGEDVDLAVLLIGRTPIDRDILFLKPSRGKIEQKLFSSSNLNAQEDVRRDTILLCHAFTGCDTTSTFYGKGKIRCVRTLRDDTVKEAIRTFYDSWRTPDEIAEAGEKLILKIYGASTKKCLNEYRFQCFSRGARKVSFKLESLPPTAAAAREHSLRVYHQVQAWLGNDFSPVSYGWRMCSLNGLMPVKTCKKAGPPELIDLVFCACVQGCKNMCGCRKSGMKCSSFCVNCNGRSCANAEETVISDSEDEEDVDEMDDYV